MSDDPTRRRDRLKAALKRLAEGSETRIDQLRNVLRARSGNMGEVRAITYRGHGNAHRILFHGRVLANVPEETPTPDDSAITNLAAMYRRFGSKEVAGARLRLTYADQEIDLTTDLEGFFRHEFEPGVPPDARTEWQEAQVKVTATPWGVPSAQAERATALCPSRSATFGVISDVDDTVLQSDAQKRLKVILRTALGNATTRLPFDGVAKLYRALRGGGDGAASNPFFYVSSSPWNLYDFLVEFFHINNLPDGPFFLKDFGLGHEAASFSDHEGHKLRTIGSLLDAHPSLDFVLMGDSGERDPEIYAKTVHRYPGRVKAVVIRDVTAPGRDAQVHEITRALNEHGVPAVLAPNSVSAADTLFELGLVPAGTAAAVAKTQEHADQETDSLDSLLDEVAATIDLEDP